MPALPTTPASVSPSWLTAVLRRSLPDLPAVVAIDWEVIGQGFGLTGVIARLRLDYAARSPNAPASLVLKLPMATPENASHYRQAQSVDDDANLRYFRRSAREVDFYLKISPQIPDIAPRAFFAAADESERVVVILLEDLSGARNGDVLAGASVDDVRAVLEQIARLHDLGWDQSAFAWLPRRDGDHASRQERLAGQIPRFFDRWGSTLSPEVQSIVKLLGTRTAAFLSILDRAPTTIIHADLHLDNVLFDAPNRSAPVILDWQSVRRGPAIVDVGRIIAESLAPDDRRRHETELLAHYHAHLTAGGVRGYSVDQLMHDYRLALGGLLPPIVGWLANSNPVRLQGREKQLVEAALGDGRLSAALIDHDLLGLLTDL